jgi:hypothetical protein
MHETLEHIFFKCKGEINVKRHDLSWKMFEDIIHTVKVAQEICGRYHAISANIHSKDKSNDALLAISMKNTSEKSRK